MRLVRVPGLGCLVLIATLQDIWDLRAAQLLREEWCAGGSCWESMHLMSPRPPRPADRSVEAIYGTPGGLEGTAATGGGAQAQGDGGAQEGPAGDGDDCENVLYDLVHAQAGRSLLPGVGPDQ